MFEETYVFQGKHADYVKELKEESGIFNRNLDVLILAPIIGFLNGRKADKHKGESTTKIFTDQMLKEKTKLEFIFKLITVLDDSLNMDQEERINYVFREKAEERLLKNFNNYTRGGVEFIYEKMYDLDSNQNFNSSSNISLLKRKEKCIYNFFEYISEFEQDLEFEEEESVEDIINKFQE